MTLTNEPAVITLADRQLRACASFPSGATTWYPSAPTSTTGTVIVLAAPTVTRNKFAVGAQGIPSGTVEMVIYADSSIGDLEELADTLVNEFMTQDAPLPARSGTVGLCSDPDGGDIAGGETRRAISLTIEFGLTA